MGRINIITPGNERSEYAEYTTEDYSTSGFWLDVKSEAGMTRLFFSAQFIKDEIIARLDIVALPKKRVAA